MELTISILAFIVSFATFLFSVLVTYRGEQREKNKQLIYTTNAIEGFNRQLRKVTKSRTVFPSDDSLLKMLYLATMDITKKWTGRRRDWSQIRAQLEIYFEERLEKAEFQENLFDMIYTCIMQIRAENPNLVSALNNYQ